MQVIATATGFDNLAVREAGEVFEMPDGSSAHWFEPVNPAKKGRKTVDDPNPANPEPLA